MWLFERSKQSAVEVPDGMSEIRVYTYNGKALKRLREGEEFKITLLNGEHKMKSVYTGSEARGNVAVAYNDKPIGFLATSKNAILLVSVRDRIGPLSLSATIVGHGAGG